MSKKVQISMVVLTAIGIVASHICMINKRDYYIDEYES